jgi:Arc/MetJ-type ribon-helix-helix transcriptional regulator
MLGFDDDLVAEINDWRRREENLPNFSDAVRELIQRGLARPSAAASRGPDVNPIKKVIGFDDDLIAEVNEWRRRQDHLPNFSDAVRELIRLGLHRPTGLRRKRDDRGRW